MVISVADLDLSGLAGNTGHTNIQAVACVLSGHLCDLAQRLIHVHTG